MRNLAEQLLDLSRLDLTAIRISPEPVRLRPKIEELVRSLAEARSNAVTIAVPPDMQAVVDPAALDRMLSNLIANSLQHGQPPVTITALGQDRHLRFVVEDRGRGVPPEFVPRLFDRFARSAESRRTRRGLGARARDCPGNTLEPTEERSSTGRRCRTERDSRSCSHSGALEDEGRVIGLARRRRNLTLMS